IIDIEKKFYGLIFCRTKIDVDTVANHLSERGYDADALHGDMSQSQREKILQKFKKCLINILVATDVAARGIDVQNLTHVINYALPQDPKSYVHRIGRTGRAGNEGNAITFITPSEYRKLQFIQRKVKTDIRKAKLPNVNDVINTKKLRIKTDLEDIIKSRPLPEYLEISKELLKNNQPNDMIAALLQYSFSEELSKKNYAQIKDGAVDTKGKTRLFVTHGKKDGLTRNKLINSIKDSCRIRSDKIKDIQILDKFSFITLPFNEAEKLLASFKKKRRGPGLTITKAKNTKK
ncbi:MAG: ATP-dependent helicase, partial [Candidatus Omnitrophota bacterium]